MSFSIIDPPAVLQPYVRFFWIFDSIDNAAGKTFRTMADGCPGIIFQHPDSGNFFQQHKRLPETFLFGQTTKYAELELTGRFSTIGVYLKPNALQTIFGFKASELTDSCLDLNLFKKSMVSGLTEQLINTVTNQQRVDLLIHYLTRQIGLNKKNTNTSMQFALDRIIQSDGKIYLNELQSILNVTERSFHRNFKEHTGISPNLFARIIRFQASLRQLQLMDYEKLSDIAYNHQYADQSHFIRSFKDFSGMSPTQFQKQTLGIVDNLTEIL